MKYKKRKAAEPVSADGGKEFVAADGTRRTKAEILRTAWESGIVAPLILRKHQVPLYESIMATPRLKARPILCSRRFGKTMTVLVCIEEIARQHPGSIIRLTFPTIKQATTVIMPNWRKVLATCPEDLKPVDRTSNDEGGWVWPDQKGPCKCGDPLCVTGPGPSILFFAGTDDADQRERQRGSDANWAFLDEAASQKELRYMVEDILSPQLDEVNGRLVMVTTPPRSLAHDFVAFWDAGLANALLFIRTIFDNTHLSKSKFRNICEERNKQESGESKEAYDKRIDEIIAAGSDVQKARRAGASSTWLREYLSARLGDTESQVCPEFDETIHVADHERPAYVQRYVFIDQGHVADFFVALFAEYDFAMGKLRVLGEKLLRHANTNKIVQELKECEEKIWCKPGEKWKDLPTSGPNAIRRWTDDPRGSQQVHDMASTPHFYNVSMADKSPGDEENSRAVRYRVNAGNIEVAPACTNLIAQMRDGVFKEKAGGKQEFERSKSFGHLDAFASLSLGCRVVNWNYNPIPKGAVQTYTGQAVFTPTVNKVNKISKVLKSLFRGAHG